MFSICPPAKKYTEAPNSVLSEYCGRLIPSIATFDSANKFRRVNHGDPRLCEFRFNGGHRTVQVDRAAGIAQHEHMQAKPARIESRVAHAVVVGEPGKKDALEPIIPQIV